MTQTNELYPSSWFGGKFRGTVDESDNKLTLRIRNPQTKTIEYKQTLRLEGPNREDQLDKARQLLRDQNIELGYPIKNQIRYISADEIEVELNHNQIMKTDAKFIEKIQEHLVYAVKSGGKLGKYYAMVYLGKKDNGKNKQSLFHKFITGNEMTDHINRDTMDNRLTNLRDTNYEENISNKTFSHYETQNNSGYRGVCRMSDSYVARIKHDGKMHSKSFSIQKYGEEKAKQLAIDFRSKMCEKFNLNDWSGFVDDETAEKKRVKTREYDEAGKLVKIECKGPLCKGKMVDISKIPTKPGRDGKTTLKHCCRECIYEQKRQWKADRKSQLQQTVYKLLDETSDDHDDVSSYNEVLVSDVDEYLIDSQRCIIPEKLRHKMTKRCPDCDYDKPLNEFSRHYMSIDGHAKRCKEHEKVRSSKTRTRVYDGDNLVKIACKTCGLQEVSKFTQQGTNKWGEPVYMPTCKTCTNAAKKSRQQSAKQQQEKVMRQAVELDLNEVIDDDMDELVLQTYIPKETQEIQRAKKISKTISAYYKTDEGKTNKQKAHEKRSETMKARHHIATEKECKSCNKTLPASSFCKKSAAVDGLQSWCKPCTQKLKQLGGPHPLKAPCFKFNFFITEQ